MNTDIVMCMWYTGIEPLTKKPVQVARTLRDRKLQRALMQFFKPENYFEVKEALLQAKRGDLIGSGCDALIPAQPPREAIDGGRKNAKSGTKGDHYHAVVNSMKGEKPGEQGVKPAKGYRPGRKSQRR